MEHKSNEEKAKHLASREMYGGFTLAEKNAAYQSAMAMAQWKDEQFAKEKQEWIDKVGEWVNDNYFEYLQPISYHEQLQNSIDINDFVNDLKKAMEE